MHFQSKTVRRLVLGESLKPLDEPLERAGAKHEAVLDVAAADVPAGLVPENGDGEWAH